MFKYSIHDDPPMAPAASSGAGDGGGGSGGGSGGSRNTGVFEPRLEQQRPPKTNQDAADAAGAGVVAALMEVGEL